MKRIKNIIYLSFAIILLQTACTTDYLNVTPPKRLDVNYWTMKQDAIDALTGAYKVLRGDYIFVNYSCLFTIGDCMSDDSRKGGRDNSDGLWLYNFETEMATTTDAENLLIWWTTTYKGARQTNLVIENVPKMDPKLFSSDPALQQRIVAEAKFLRAFLYFVGINIFGENIPLVLEPMTAADEGAKDVPFTMPNAKNGEIYAQIEKDLTEAAATLPWKYAAAADLGRATKGAALGLLAKTYIWEKKWQQAYDCADQVIKSNTYNLMGVKFEKLWDCAYEFNANSVWEIPFGGQSALSNPSTGNFANIYNGPRNSSFGFGWNLPSMNLWNAFEPGDPRRSATIIKYGDVIRKGTPDQTSFTMAYNPVKNNYYAFDATGKKIEGTVTDLNRLGFDHCGHAQNLDSMINYKYYLPRKYVPNDMGLNAAFGETNWRYLQIAEIYLFRAEAATYLGKAEECKQDLLAVRHRAKLSLTNPDDPTILPDSKITSLAGRPLLDAVYQERRVELAMEASRWFDLMRRDLNETETIMNNYFATEKKYKLDGISPKFNRKYKNLPIPASEITKSAGVIVQNPGW